MQFWHLYALHFFLFALGTIFAFSMTTDEPETGSACATLETPEERTDLSGLASYLSLSSYLYIGCLLLTLNIFLLCRYFANSFLPGDFGKLGRTSKCGGFLVRMSLRLLNLIHWVLLIPNLLFLYEALMLDSECTITDLGLSYVILFILPSLWVVQHIGGALLRSFIDIDTFLLVPEDPDSSKYWQIICVDCGP